MQMDFISRVGHVVMTLSIFKTGHLNPTPTVSMTDTMWGCADIWMLHNCSDIHTHTHTYCMDSNTKSNALLDLHIQTHTQCTCDSHTRHDNSCDICIYVKLASPHSLQARTQSFQRTEQRDNQSATQRWQKRIPDPGAFTRPSIHTSMASFFLTPLLFAFPHSFIFNNTGMHACIRDLILWGHQVSMKNGHLLFTPSQSTPSPGPQAFHF